MMVLWLKRILLAAMALIVATAALIIARTSPEPWSPQEITRLTIALNEAAAIGVPHGFLMQDDMRTVHIAIIDKVERGEVLTTTEEVIYRQVFQTVLRDSQSFLARFDAELSILMDHAMPLPNNVEGSGISGPHDHHDLSARKNFTQLLVSLQKLDAATTAFGRIRYANSAQKDLVDLISHLGVAPHTVSVPYEKTTVAWPDPVLGAEFEAMLQNFKQAQFLPINGPDYWSAIDTALQHYSNLILAVQQRVQHNTSPWQRKVAGRFLSVQTGAPPVEFDRPLRRK